ncbi:MAG TPA: anthrone oxygenase family protein [Phototrophicaceae bacterium]|jgi:uncharacterized membrane protein|nr:anthrone oxygenase family protein [Phototrophicaceae bacterium]
MLLTFENIVLVIAGTLTGLSAGVYYTFNVAVMPALRAIRGKQHIAMMQAVNIKIQNPVFFLSFFGPTVLLPLAAWQNRDLAEFPLLVAAALLHIVGVNGVTVVGNIPINDKLEKINTDHLSEEEADQIREEFHGTASAWMRLHNIRTITATLATALVLIACLSKSMSR